MKQYKRVLSFVTAAALSASFPVQAMAANPEFAHDEATWARLRDNVMEYDELQMLVEEYNPNYMNRQVSYRDTKEEKDNSDIRQNLMSNAEDMEAQADSFREQADSLLDVMEMGIPVPGFASAYAAMSSAAAMMENRAMTQRISADSQYEDSETRKYRYMKDQTGLVVSAQGMFGSYHQLLKSMEVLDKNKELVENVYRSTETRAGVGMATQIDVLNAKKNVQSLESGYIQSQSSLNNIKQNLCLMTGWAYNDNPEIKEMPQADLNRILLMNPDADRQQALDNNYDLKYNKRIYENMSEGSADRKNMERTIKNQEATIAANLNNLYNDVIHKKTAFELAQAELATAEKSMSAAETKRELGMMSSLEYLQQQSDYAAKQLDCGNANIQLFQAIETYDWALKGYMAGQ